MLIMENELRQRYLQSLNVLNFERLVFPVISIVPDSGDMQDNRERISGHGVCLLSSGIETC